MSAAINIEVVYALPDVQTLFMQSFPEGSTVGEAIRLCGILDKYPEIDLAVNRLGIFGRLSRLDEVLHDKDRIEIYRPLIADPKEMRRKRAAQGKTMKKGREDA